MFCKSGPRMTDSWVRDISQFIFHLLHSLQVKHVVCVCFCGQLHALTSCFHVFWVAIFHDLLLLLLLHTHTRLTALCLGLPGWAGSRKTNLDFTDARDSEWQWRQLGHMQVCILLQTDYYYYFNGVFSRTPWSLGKPVPSTRKAKPVWIYEARDDEVSVCSGISWTICKQSACPSRQITTPTHQLSIFTSRMLFLTPSQQCESTEGISVTD